MCGPRHSLQTHVIPTTEMHSSLLCTALTGHINKDQQIWLDTSPHLSLCHNANLYEEPCAEGMVAVTQPC